MYAYNAELFCDDCGKAIIGDLAEAGIEDTGDTNDFPQWADEDTSETDSPSHCAECASLLLESLTKEGRAYVAEALTSWKGDEEVLTQWAEYFGSECGWFDVSDLDEHERDALRERADDIGPEYALETWEDDYAGLWRSEADYAAQFVDDCGLLSDIHESVRRYFDYEAYARDLFMGDLTSYKVAPGLIAVFWNN